MTKHKIKKFDQPPSQAEKNSGSRRPPYLSKLGAAKSNKWNEEFRGDLEQMYWALDDAAETLKIFKNYSNEHFNSSNSRLSTIKSNRVIGYKKVDSK